MKLDDKTIIDTMAATRKSFEQVSHALESAINVFSKYNMGLFMFGGDELGLRIQEELGQMIARQEWLLFRKKYKKVRQRQQHGIRLFVKYNQMRGW